MNDSTLNNEQQHLARPRLMRLAFVFIPLLAVFIAAALSMRTPVAVAALSNPSANAQKVAQPLSSGVTIGAQVAILTKDSNKPCATNASNPTPMGGYLLVFITDTAATTLNGVTASITGFVPTGAFAQQLFLGDNEQATKFIGTMNSGDVVPIYWFTKFATTCDKPDESFNYTVTVGDSESGVVSQMFTVTMRQDISALAGGTIVASGIGPGTFLGQILTVTIVYNNGNTGSGSDLILMPNTNGVAIGNGFDTVWNPFCFELIKDTVDGQQNYTGITVPEDNRIEYPVGSIGSGGGSKNVVTVTYYYRVNCVGSEGSIDAYSTQSSGTQEKYTLGVPATTVPTPTNPLQIKKTAQSKVINNGHNLLITWTVFITNGAATVPVFIDSVTDMMPSSPASPSSPAFGGTTGASDVNSANSFLSPTVGTTSNPLTWTARTKGVNFKIPASGVISLVYTMTTPGSDQFGIYTNTAGARVGGVILGPVTATAGFFGSTVVDLITFDGNANGGLPWLPLALGAVGVLILGSLAVVLGRKE